LDHFKVTGLKGFGIEKMDLGQTAAGAIIHYLESTEHRANLHITKIARINTEEFVWLDEFTVRNLELIYPNHPGGTSLSEILDKTVSPLGGRLLKKWILLPLLSKNKIESRQHVVSYFVDNHLSIDELSEEIQKVGDLERFIAKAALKRIGPREIKHMERALESIAALKISLSKYDQEELKIIGDGFNKCEILKEKINLEIVDDPPALLSKGGIFKEGFNPAYDELKGLIRNSKEILLAIQKKEAESTGITNLKIGFNNVFGYYLEVTNKYKNLGLIPDHWVRKQTLTGSERYISEELKEIESKILNAEERISILEEELFFAMVDVIQQYIEPMQTNANLIARLDCLLSFAKLAIQNKYCCPTMSDHEEIEVIEGRHPVIEKNLALGEKYIPNNIFLDQSEQQIIMITGPNMSGKSAVLRQTALICLMAQMGSYVPAKTANIGIVDKIFTRVGASDNISSGESTFMVEMNETASIMNNISSKSLILLDEIGRGTSTYDGISIAWSLAEFLHESQEKPKTLFATHYHELNELSNKFDRIKNFNVATKEVGDKVLFLRKLKRGGSQHSFGIHVAKIAGMPVEIVDRANEILKVLESKSIKGQHAEQLKNIESSSEKWQLNFFESTDPEKGEIIQRIQESDINGMTPIECLNLLNDLKNILEKD